MLRVRDEPEWIHHVEFQAGPDATLPRRANLYNAVLEGRHGSPVRSSAILLCRAANLSVINGRYELMQEVMGMEESSTYQFLIAKGKALGERTGAVSALREVILKQGRERFGKPGARVKAAVEAVDEPHRLVELSVRLLHAASWEELLDLAPKGRRHE